MSTNPLSGPLYAWIYFGAIITTAFYGFACMQTFFYYVHYQGDALRLKIFVAAVWALNTTHEALVIDGAYKYITAGLENPLSLLNWVPELHLQILVTALVAVLTQGFLIYRLSVVSGRRVIALLSWVVLSLLQIVPITVYVAKALYTADGTLQVVDIATLNDNVFKTLLTLGLSAAAAGDVLIAISLVSFLVHKRATANNESTAQMLHRLIMASISTGTWTAMFAVSSLIFMYVLPSEMLYTLFAFPICTIYCNTVLANLNARAYLRDGSRVQHVPNIDLPWSTTPSPDGRQRWTKLAFARVGRTGEFVSSSDTNVELGVSGNT